jgi:predicted transcriptional regulator
MNPFASMAKDLTAEKHAEIVKQERWKPGELQAAILAVLRQAKGPITKQAIRDAVGAEHEVHYKAIRVLIKKGLVAKCANGRDLTRSHELPGRYAWIELVIPKGEKK